jgi:hypothetical protein
MTSQNDNCTLDIYQMSGIAGATECVLFISPNEGYAFNQIMKHDNWTDEQLDDPNYPIKISYNSMIYKTLDGGRNWEMILDIENTTFGNTARFDNNSIYIPIFNGLGRKKDQLMKYDLKEIRYQLFSFFFNGFGDLWLDGENIFIQNRKLYKIDKAFTTIDSLRLDKKIMYKPVLCGGEHYALVFENEILNLSTNVLTNIEGLAAECITEINQSNFIIAGEQGQGGIAVYNFDVDKKQAHFVTSFKGYSIVRYLKSNNHVICGFIGNIEGMFTNYDLFYSLDKGKTWQIKKLQDSYSIHQNSLIDNILYIVSGNLIQRIEFQ